MSFGRTLAAHTFAKNCPKALLLSASLITLVLIGVTKVTTVGAIGCHGDKPVNTPFVVIESDCSWASQPATLSNTRHLTEFVVPDNPIKAATNDKKAVLIASTANSDRPYTTQTMRDHYNNRFEENGGWNTHNVIDLRQSPEPLPSEQTEPDSGSKNSRSCPRLLLFLCP